MHYKCIGWQLLPCMRHHCCLAQACHADQQLQGGDRPTGCAEYCCIQCRICERQGWRADTVAAVCHLLEAYEPSRVKGIGQAKTLELEG